MSNNVTVSIAVLAILVSLFTFFRTSSEIRQIRSQANIDGFAAKIYQNTIMSLDVALQEIRLRDCHVLRYPTPGC